jgi:hypothetical protein
MIEPAFGAPLMPAVGAAALLEAGLVAASRAAITLAPVAMPTDPEHRVAFPAAANPLPENRFAMHRHPRPRAGLDNGNRSWQVKTIHSGDLLLGLPTGTPPLATAGSHVLFPPSRNDLTPWASRPDDRRTTRACGADDVVGSRRTFRKLRFQMIDDTLAPQARVLNRIRQTKPILDSRAEIAY